jgi:hypothetical protein
MPRGIPTTRPTKRNLCLDQALAMKARCVRSGSRRREDLRRQLSSVAMRNRAIRGRSVCRSLLFLLGLRCFSSWLGNGRRSLRKSDLASWHERRRRPREPSATVAAGVGACLATTTTYPQKATTTSLRFLLRGYCPKECLSAEIATFRGLARSGRPIRNFRLMEVVYTDVLGGAKWTPPGRGIRATETL